MCITRASSIWGGKQCVPVYQVFSEPRTCQTDYMRLCVLAPCSSCVVAQTACRVVQTSLALERMAHTSLGGVCKL